MSNNQLYAVAYVYVNGGLLAEAASVSVKRATNSQPVTTIVKGYAGESPGASMTEISIEGAVPAAGFEMNPGPFMAQLKAVEFTMFVAGAKMTFKGFITEDNFQYAVNSEAKLSFSARGNFADYT
jgi:hypothetical protein